MLAEKLGMTVAEMRQSMSQQEYMHWGIYYARQAQDVELAQKRANRKGR